jgi:filamentous hemagglutinin family protein
MRTILKKYYLRQIVACWMVSALLLTFAPVRTATALPNGWNVVYGGNNAMITTSGGNHVIVTLQQLQTIINWNSLDTSSSEILSFLNNGLTDPAVLNRVISGNMTHFDGTLNGLGVRVFIINPAGIVFGQGAQINVSQLVASSLDIADNDFLNGAPYEFIAVRDDLGKIISGDVIFNAHADNVMAERLFLIGKNVRNKGGLVATEFAVMAAGDRVLISEPDSSVAVEVDMGGLDPAEFTVMNKAHALGEDTFEGSVGDVPTSVEAEHIILAAGDVWSAALTKAYSNDSSSPVATVDIDAAGDVTVTDKVIAEAVGNRENDAVAAVTVNSGGNVEVIAEDGEALIQAKTDNGVTNTSEVLICADGHLAVKAEGVWYDESDWPYASDASIQAIAGSIESMAQNNTADVKIGAKEGIEVTATGDEWLAEVDKASASITAQATGGVESTASVIACTQGDVQVKAGIAGEAKITSEALNAHTTDAYVGICAVDDVIVASGIGPESQQGSGGTAMIKAEAGNVAFTSLVNSDVGASQGSQEPPTANAKVTVVSHNGGVGVIDVRSESQSPPATAKIEALAHGAYENTAYVGVAAGGNLSHVPQWIINELGLENVPNVLVAAMGPGSSAYISSYASGYENFANTVVCTPGEVTVTHKDGGEAKIESIANGERNNATTQVYANEVTVSEGDHIGAIAGGNILYVPESGEPGYCLTDDGKVAWAEGGATLIIDNYSSKKDCPDCPPCPCQKPPPPPPPIPPEEEVLAPVAPLPPYRIPRIEGCPETTKAAAAELGIPEETLQVGMGNALALNPNIQPCQACASLVNAATILKDADGSRMAAMIQVFNAIAPADAPYTPEMATSIAMAFDNAAEGSQYASAMEFVDAFVQYAAALGELGSPTGDPTVFVMDKYGAGLSENGNMANFVAGRIESGQTF